MSIPEPSIEVKGLSKRYDNVSAVDGISFTIHQGELFGFLGPNGAGKTTTINILTGLARPDSGTIMINGLDFTRNPKAAQQLIGVVPDESNLYPELTGFENLCFCASLYGVRKREGQMRARELLDLFNLQAAADRKFSAYSKGMKRKLTIAAAIVHHPTLLFLDEPTTGIDVESARQTRQLIADLHHLGTTIFITTHYIEEAERLCERIAFIVKGQIVKIDTVANLLQPVKEKNVILLSVTELTDKLCPQLSLAFPQIAFQAISSEHIRAESTEVIHLSPLVRYIESQGAEVTEAHRLRPSLEDVFIEVTGLALDSMRKEKEKSGGRL